MELALRVIETSVIVAAAIASYFRFFRGRMLTPRLGVKVTASVIPATKNTVLHTVRIEVENSGSVPVWDPRPHVVVTEHAQLARKEITYGPELWMLKTRHGRTVIDTGETVEFDLDHQVSKECWAASYFVVVTCSSDKQWTRAVTVSTHLDESE